MWHKGTPLENFFLGFKHTTVHITAVYAIALALFGLFIVGTNAAIGILIMVHAGFAYWCGHSLKTSLDREEKARKAADSNDES